MPRRLLKPLATMVGAAALLVAPIAFLAPSATADHVLTPDDFLPNEPEYNNEENWEETLSQDEDLEDVMCIKIEGEELDDPYLIPELAPDRFYVVAVVKGGSGDMANEIYEYPEAGHYLSHATAGNSHIILCTAEEEETSTTTATPPVTSPPATTTAPSTTMPPVTGPVVETDRVVDSGPAAGIALAAGVAALLIGASSVAFNRRRQGNHR